MLEFAPGVELFDAILSKSGFSEEEARPVFVQVRQALSPSPACGMVRGKIDSHVRILCAHGMADGILS